MNWKASSKILLLSSVVIFVLGIGMTTVFGPCFSPGAIMTEIAVGTAALSCLGLLVATVKGQSHWTRLAAGVTGTCVIAFLGFWWTLMLCRGV
jgi:hypothetical protein